MAVEFRSTWTVATGAKIFPQRVQGVTLRRYERKMIQNQVPDDFRPANGFRPALHYRTRLLTG